MKKIDRYSPLLFGIIILVCACYSDAQTPVVLAPVPQLQFFTQTGQPLSYGCVFTYQVASTTPLGTYTDYTGTTLNANPVVLSAGGSGNIWLTAGQAYTFKIKSSGGLNCASGTTLYTVNGIGGGSSTLTTVVTYSSTPTFNVAAQNQLFTITLSGNASAQPLTFVGITPPSVIFFQITQDATGGRTFSWPANSIGGCTIGAAANAVTTQEFIYNGTNATAIGPCVIGNGPAIDAGSLSLSGTITAAGFLSNSSNIAASGIFRMASGDGIAWRNNANSADLLLTKNASDNLVWPNGLSLGGGTALTTTNQSGTGNLCLVTSCQLVTPALNGVIISGTPSAGNTLTATDSTHAGWSGSSSASFNLPQRVVLSSPVTLTANVQTIVLTETVTFPSAAGTYRADSRYGVWITAGSNACAAEVIDSTNTRAFALSGQDANGSGYMGLSGAEVSTQTYAASATATFTLQVQCNMTETATVNSGLFTFSPAEPTYLSVTPVASN